MYQTIPETFYMYDAKDGKFSRIGTVDELVSHVARLIRQQTSSHPYTSRYGRWAWTRREFEAYLRNYEKENVFANQNLTGNDGHTYYRTEAYRYADKDSGEERVCYNYIPVFIRHRFTFYNHLGAVVDIRKFEDEVREKLSREDPFVPRRSGQGRRPHSSWKEKWNHPRDDRTFHDDELVNFHVKKSRQTAKDAWWDFVTRRGSGWKSRKDRKQWQHGVRNRKAWESAASCRLWFRDVELDEELFLIEHGKDMAS